jgi:hypothetical protein
MRYRRLILGFLLAFGLVGPGPIHGANLLGSDDQFPPPPVVSDIASPTPATSTAPAPPTIPDSQAAAQPPAPPIPSDGSNATPPVPPVPPEVSDSTPVASASSPAPAPPVIPDNQTAVQPPAPPMPPDVSTASPPVSTSSTIPTPPAIPDSQAAVQPPAPPPPPEVSANASSTPIPTPATTPSTISAAPAAPPVPPAATPVADAYDQALSLFKQKQYQDAIPFFKQALVQKPGDPKLYYYLGSCQYKAGHTRDAVVSLGIACKLRPDIKLQDFVRRLRAPLTIQEKQWADAQVDAYGTGKTSDVPAPVDYPQFGLRLQPQISFFNLAEFNADTQSQAYYATQSTDPSYHFTSSVPQALIGYIMEPVLRMDTHLEFGLPLSYLPVGTVTENIQSAVYGNSSISYALSAFVGGLDVKLLTGDRPLQFFAAIGPRLASIEVNVNYSNPSASGGSDFNSVVFGGEAQVGLDWELASNFLLSPSIGYRWLQSGHLTGNINNGGQNTFSRLEYAPNSSGGPEITVVPEAGPDPTGESPLKVDLSGITGGLTLSALF